MRIFVFQVRGKNIPITGDVLKAKASLFAKEMNVQDFKTSNGWLQKFVKRQNLTFKTMCGESAVLQNYRRMVKKPGGNTQRLLGARYI